MLDKCWPTIAAEEIALAVIVEAITQHHLLEKDHTVVQATMPLHCYPHPLVAPTITPSGFVTIPFNRSTTGRRRRGRDKEAVVVVIIVAIAISITATHLNHTDDEMFLTLYTVITSCDLFL